MKNKISLLSLALIGATLAGFSGPVEAGWFKKEAEKKAEEEIKTLLNKYGKGCYSYCKDQGKVSSLSAAKSCGEDCVKHHKEEKAAASDSSSTDTDASTDTTDSSGQ